MELLTVLETLGDETRLALYRELATSTGARAAGDLAEELGLHVNTVRLHLERLRDAGLVEVHAVRRGTVGRPQHAYSLAADAPGLGLDPPASDVLAGLLAGLAERLGADAEDAAYTGHAWGVESARRVRSRGRRRSCVDVLDAEMARLGFDPDLATADDRASIAFLHCPFRELAEAYPELVCNLHRGICEGVVEEVGGGSVDEFAALYDREPCHVTVAVGQPDDRETAR